MGGRMGRAGHLRVRSHRDARAGLLGRHPAADGLRVAARRARLQLHAHRRGRALPAHAGQAGLLPDGVGRQRAADRATRPELLRGALRAEPALRPRLHPAGEAGQAADRDLAAQLRRALRDADRRGREGLRGAVAPRRAVGRLEPHLPDHRRPGPRDQPARLPAEPGARRGLRVDGADPVGRHVPHRGGAGRARGPRAHRRLAPHRVPRHRGPGLHRDDEARAHPGVRRPDRASRRRALPAAVRDDGPLAALRRRGPRPRAPGRRDGPRRRHRDVLHLRRPDRRAVVARARPAQPHRHHPRRPAAARDARVDHLGRGPHPVRRGRRDTVFSAQGEDRRDARRERRPRGRRPAGHAAGQVLREGRQAARDRLQPPVVPAQRRPRRATCARRCCAAARS